MAPIILERLDEGLFDAINALAKARKVSIEEQIVVVLREALQGRRRESLIARADAIAAMTPKGVKQTDSTILIREDRDR